MSLLSVIKAAFRAERPRHQPVHSVPRYHAATKAENAAARQRRADIRCELAVYAATTTQAQRALDTETFFAAAREREAMRGRGR